MKSLVAPDALDTKSFSQLVKLVQEHYQPKPSAIVMRFRFNSCIRQHGESVAAFVARLCQLSEHCDYGASLNDILRDRLVCGIEDERLQRRLLAESTLTFQKAFQTAQASQSAEANANALSTAQVHVAWIPDRCEPRRDEGRDVTPCYRCGNRHAATSCRFRDATCNHCGRKGHIMRACRSRNRPAVAEQQPSRTAKPFKGGPQRANRVSEETSEVSDPGDPPLSAEYTMFQVSTDKLAPFSTSVVVNGTTLHMEVDTGAALALISQTTYNCLWPKECAPELRDVFVRLRTYTGEELNVLGSAPVTVKYKEQQQDLNLLVVQGNGPSLLGRDWLAKIRLDWSELHSIQSSTVPLEEVLAAHSDLFKDEFGTVRGTTANIQVDPSACPRFYRPRSVPFALREGVEKALARLEKEGIIESVEFLDWAAPIVPRADSEQLPNCVGVSPLTLLSRGCHPSTHKREVAHPG